MNREDFIKFIPKPNNKDVILYDISLQDLIDVDVLGEYDKLYSSFLIKKKRYLDLKAKLEEYQKMIDSIYLFMPSWNEADYLQNLQNYKKTYNTLYKEIKKIETNIAVLQKKILSINEKIQLQIAKESKQEREEKNNIDVDIDKTREKMTNYKTFLETYKIALNQIEEQLSLNQQNFDDLVAMEQKLKNGECQCELCGRTIKNTSEDSMIYKRLISQMEKNKKQLEKILKQKEKIEVNVEYYQTEAQKCKNKLDNILEFRKETKNFYQKKSVEILKLEASKNEAMNTIAKLEKQLKGKAELKSKEYLELKNKIDKCELSLDNLKRVKEIKENSLSEIEEFNSLKKELKTMIETLTHYLDFMKIYFKIIEQKANEFCGEEYKFSFYKIEEYEFIPFFNVKYMDINYADLDQKTRTEIDKFLMKKFSIYS